MRIWSLSVTTTCATAQNHQHISFLLTFHNVSVFLDSLFRTQAKLLTLSLASSRHTQSMLSPVKRCRARRATHQGKEQPDPASTHLLLLTKLCAQTISISASAHRSSGQETKPWDPSLAGFGNPLLQNPGIWWGKSNSDNLLMLYCWAAGSSGSWGLETALVQTQGGFQVYFSHLWGHHPKQEWSGLTQGTNSF